MKINKLAPENRLYRMDRPIIGLTGSIATGKSSVTKILREMGYFIIDADELVKNIYRRNETYMTIKSNYPEVIVDEKIDFKKLRELFFNNETTKKTLENFIYAKLESEFKREAERCTQDFIIYDVPLLFEKNLDELVDLKVVVYTPEDIQLKRLMERDSIDQKLATQIMMSQMSIEEKRRRADLIIDNSNDLKSLKHQVVNFTKRLS